MTTKFSTMGLALCAMIMCGCGDTCGDGVVTGIEQCDDGNAHAGDGCGSMCAIESGYTCPDGMTCDPVCQDGILANAEVCDPSLTEYTEYCSADCTMIIASCGDASIQHAHESCDDGNSSPRDGCTAQCEPAFGWQCDAATGACDASTIDPSLQFGELSDTQRNEFCTWMITMLGGSGARHNCGALIWTVNSVSMCEDALSSATPTCTVSDFEGWTADRGGACAFFESDVPIC